MPFSTAQLVTLAAAVSSASATFRGFNYGALKGSVPKTQTDFENEFTAASALPGTDGKFSSARLYTMIQGGTPNEPISAIPAAIKCKTSLLLGLWASAGEASFANEIEALRKTTKQYCKQLDGLVAGISVGSEDLYRETPTGKQNKEYAGTSPKTLVNYIRQTREAVKGTCLEKAPIGHVDTWTAYANSSNEAVFPELDWLGVDEYPYYEYQKPNAIEEADKLFHAAIDEVQKVINKGGKNQEIWITEMGWPVEGKTTGQAVASKKNAEYYWKKVACPTFIKRNVWYYTLQDGDAQNKPNPSFGLVNDLKGKPLIDLSCSGSQASNKSESDETDDSGSGSGGKDKSASGNGSGETDKSGSGKESEYESGSKCTSGQCSGSDKNSGSGSDYGSSSGNGSGKCASGQCSGSGEGQGSDNYGSGSGSGKGSDNYGSGSESGSGKGSGSDSYGSGSSSGKDSDSGSSKGSDNYGSGSESGSGKSSGPGSETSSGSGCGSGQCSGSNPAPAVSTLRSYPSGASNSSANGNAPGYGNQLSPTTVAQAAGSHLSSLGAAAVALVLAVAAL
ncbi:hypothetical protein XA68_18527 [Ophiocordyceps unilateralis]|uniref:Probable glucan endo-1,3-beta-glucosidase eglC n=1 Tax=Ophiocordyceps unilateralis TaxID=268505 RepID=A0A2A9PJ69_OPHUN|nr:hypothetical protein XA68_18527 [Ophiocordyceps unilateralis]